MSRIPLTLLRSRSSGPKSGGWWRRPSIQAPRTPDGANTTMGKATAVFWSPLSPSRSGHAIIIACVGEFASRCWANCGSRSVRNLPHPSGLRINWSSLPRRSLSAASSCSMRGTLMTAAKISCSVVMILAKTTITMTTPVTPILFLIGGLSESEVGGVQAYQVQ